MATTVSSGRIRSGRSLAVWRVPRTRGLASGVLLVLLGAWGGLVPFIGPHFGYAYTPYATWAMTAGRLWLEVAPGAVTVLGGLILIGSTSRALGLWAGWLTSVAGAWFVVGPIVSRLWNAGQSLAGSPVGTATVRTVVEQLGFFSGLGVVIVFLAAAALGRFSVIGLKESLVAQAEQEAAVAEQDAAIAESETVTEPTGTDPRIMAQPVRNPTDDPVTAEIPIAGGTGRPARTSSTGRFSFGRNNNGTPKHAAEPVRVPDDRIDGSSDQVDTTNRN